MATASPFDRSPSDFSSGNVISLGRSTPSSDVEDFSETTPLFGTSVRSPQAETQQGDCKDVVITVKYNAFD